MRLDRANRSFLGLLAVSGLVGAFLFCGMLGGVLIPLLLARVSGDGLGALASASMAPAFAFLTFVSTAVGFGVRSLAGQLLASRRLARYVSEKAVVPPDALRSVAAHECLCGRVACLDSPGSFSFVWGLFTPRIVVSRGLVEAASARELSAVIEHERYHVRNLDPLKIVLARSLSAALFFLPAVGALRARYLADCELAADRQAIIRYGKRSLAVALARAVRGPSSDDLGVAASLGGADLLDVRVTQLETGAEPGFVVLGRSRLGLSILSVSLLTVAYLASAYGLGGSATLYRVTGSGLASATVLGGFLCALPLALAASLLGLAIVLPTRRPII